ncbi:MAG: ABC transporter ATP-binding protein [Pseudomonadota bacterium]
MLNQIYHNWQLFLRSLSFLRPYWKQLLGLILLSQIVVLLGLISPYLTKILIDDAYVNKDFSLFSIIILTIASIILVSGVLGGIVEYFNGKINQRVYLDINNKIVNILMSLSLDYHKSTQAGKNLYKLYFDTEACARMLTDYVIQALRLFLTFLITFIIVFYLNAKIALLTFFLGIFFYFHALYFSKKRRSVFRQIISQRQSIFIRLKDAFAKIYMIKASAKEEEEKKMHLEKLNKTIEIAFVDLRLKVISFFSAQVMKSAVIGVVIFYGGYLIFQNELSLGVLTSIIVYLGRLAGFNREVGQLVQWLGVSLISCERLDLVLKEEKSSNTKTGKNKKTPKTFCPHIKIENLCFSYDNEKQIISNLNGEIKPFKWTLFRGDSGCGKSTVINMILGFYKPQQGKIYLDNENIETLDSNFIKENIALVPQEPNLWFGSIKYNVTYFNSKAKDSDLQKILKITELENFITSLENGIETEIGEDAGKVSEGQKQRISLARALLKNPKLLVLDEALSFVDDKTSYKILKNIKDNYPNITILFISHKKADLEFADKIVEF